MQKGSLDSTSPQHKHTRKEHHSGEAVLYFIQPPISLFLSLFRSWRHVCSAGKNVCHPERKQEFLTEMLVRNSNTIIKALSNFPGQSGKWKWHNTEYGRISCREQVKSWGDVCWHELGHIKDQTLSPMELAKSSPRWGSEEWQRLPWIWVQMLTVYTENVHCSFSPKDVYGLNQSPTETNKTCLVVYPLPAVCNNPLSCLDVYDKHTGLKSAVGSPETRPPDPRFSGYLYLLLHSLNGPSQRSGTQTMQDHGTTSLLIVLVSATVKLSTLETAKISK